MCTTRAATVPRAEDCELLFQTLRVDRSMIHRDKADRAVPKQGICKESFSDIVHMAGSDLFLKTVQISNMSEVLAKFNNDNYWDMV